MSVNDEILTPTSDSFWEVDCYKRCVKRQDDANKLCGDLMQLIQDRAEIEKHYAKSLKAWSKKWNDLVEKGPEYGTTEAAWKGVFHEADQVADLHLGVKDRLLGDVHATIKQWRSEHFHKPMVGPTKETKELEDGFKKAQKPWAKKLSKVLKTKKEYHTACKLEKTATHQENNAKGDSGVSPDQIKKLQDRAEKCRRDVETTKERYEAALNDLNSYNAKYMEDMTEIFNKSQDLEEKRLKFFKEMLFGIHKCLDLSASPDFSQNYEMLYSTIDRADYSMDLRWWSQNHGADMPMNWPQFEEYSPELGTINKRESKKGGGISGSDGITLTSINRNSTAGRPPSYYDTHQTSNSTTPQAPAAQTNNTTPPVSAQSNGTQNAQNPFGEEEWDEFNNDLVDDGSEGVMVKALYDYEGMEEDELTFKMGDVFTKLRDRDEQGWCKGRKDGRVGLYPDNYAEQV